MRRPLLQPDGTPIFQLSAGVLTLFSAKDLDPAYTYAVTLYAWFPQGQATVISVGIQTPGNAIPLVPAGIWDGTVGNSIDAYRENGQGPAKVLDHVVIRGDQSVLSLGLGSYGAAGVTWYGYIERVGEAPTPAQYRPLQPTNDLVEPFNAPDNIIVVPQNAAPPTSVQTIHALDTAEERLDYLTLWVSAVVSAAPGSLPACTLKMPGGVNIPIPIEQSSSDVSAGNPLLMFDAIPLRAPSPNDNLIQLEVLGATGGDVTAVAYGHFSRS